MDSSKADFDKIRKATKVGPAKDIQYQFPGDSALRRQRSRKLRSTAVERIPMVLVEMMPVDAEGNLASSGLIVSG
ncbi:MAG TPA: hypothetical protein VE621_23355 [Bryobacteraceae bacterium]|nr:hypothetical protein [Bryobacteraceae bacterium]